MFHVILFRKQDFKAWPERLSDSNGDPDRGDKAHSWYQEPHGTVEAGCGGERPVFCVL